MEAVKQWTFSVCAAMVACGLMQMLLPKSNLEKVFRLTVSVFFLCCLLSPVLLRMPQLRVELGEQSARDAELRAGRLSALLESQAQGAAEKSLRGRILEKLSEMGINPGDITINFNTGGQNAAGEFGAEILLDKSYRERRDEILAELRKIPGADIRLRYE